MSPGRAIQNRNRFVQSDEISVCVVTRLQSEPQQGEREKDGESEKGAVLQSDNDTSDT